MKYQLHAMKYLLLLPLLRLVFTACNDESCVCPGQGVLTGSWDATYQTTEFAIETSVWDLVESNATISGTIRLKRGIWTTTSGCSGTVDADGALFIELDTNDSLNYTEIRAVATNGRDYMSGVINFFERSDPSATPVITSWGFTATKY